jgi:hypothetical protein
MRFHLLAAAGLFALAFGARWWLRQGLVLGDDPQEFAALLHILTSGPLFTDQLHVRFGGWLFNHLGFWLLGVSEEAFLLPTALVTSTFGVMAYAIFVRWGYGPIRAILGGALVALAPFELVLGSLRANDSYLELALAVGFAGLVLLENRPVRQGLVVAVALWFGFYVKMFVVYALPPLGLYFLAGRRWRAFASFVVSSLVVHGVTCVYWKTQTGGFFPFLSAYAANYPVPLADLPELFLRYPRLMFVGSFEFPTTLWGAVPYVLTALLAVKLVGAVVRVLPDALRLDRNDVLLLGFWGSFFSLMEFFPNGFALDAYYSVPRIFRYLAPISFPISVHAAKCVLDLTRLPAFAARANAVAVGLIVPLLVVYVWQGVRANGPSSNYRKVFHEVLHDVEEMRPPMLVAESVVASYLRDLYLDPGVHQTEVVILHTQHSAPDYEKWLRENEAQLKDGTLLITGLASFVHYGAHIDGFRLEWFSAPLSPAWKLVREYDTLTFLPRPERARIWRLERAAAAGSPVVHDVREDLSSLRGVDDPNVLFRGGMAEYDATDYPAARVYFRKLLRMNHPESENAAFFYAATFHREGAFPRARHEFKRLIRRHPKSRWIPAAYWHIAMCEKNAGRNSRARRLFAMIVRRFPYDPATVNLARRDLETFQRRRGGVLIEWWRSL